MPDYLEINYNDNIFPVTRFMFLDSENVGINWYKVSDFSYKGNGIISGSTRVDAYSVDNKSAFEYISKREKIIFW